MARVLVVEDEVGIRDGVVFALVGEGHDVVEAGDGVAALEAAGREPFDLVVLDAMLPRLSGFEVARRLRAGSLGVVSIVMLTARSSETDLILGLEAGADDYVTKPFSTAELLARIRAQLRRRQLDRGDSRVRRVGRLELDLERHSATVDKREVQLTPSEARLLDMLSATPDRPVARDDLISALWSSNHLGDRRVCDTHVANLRRKLRDSAGERIATIHGVGYMLRSV